MIDWQKINNTNVVRTFRRICYKWWEVDIQFFDEYGECKSNTNSIQFRNHLCKFIHSDPTCSKNCTQNYKKYLRGFKKEDKFIICKCFAGLNMIAVPILTKDDNLIGTIVGSGLLLSKMNDANMKSYVNKLIKLGLDKTALEESYNNLKEGDNFVKDYLRDFLELIAEDIMAFYEMLQEKEEIIKKQSVLLERAYNAKYKGIIGTSPKMKKIFDTLELIENSGSTVLIDGESGTGKELLAAAIHYNSQRRDKMFVTQNCSAFSDTLLNSELFGHEKGSFTGATAEKKGLFEIADGGTLFLDEVGDMKLDAQARLLRVMEDGSFFRVGGSEQRRVDVRILAATNKKLSEQVHKGFFRKDLFYRINTIQLTLPPLRERKDDIILLTNYFLESYSEMHSNEKKELSQRVIDKFLAYDWPGNIRELRNIVERLVILSGKDMLIDLKHLPEEIMTYSNDSTPSIDNLDKSKKLQDALRVYEKMMIEEQLERSSWNKTSVSKRLGISRATLNNKIEQYNITK